jgi:hypothetical protein
MENQIRDLQRDDAPPPDATKRRIEKVCETQAPERHHLLRCDWSNSWIDSESYLLINLKSFNADASNISA